MKKTLLKTSAIIVGLLAAGNLASAAIYTTSFDSPTFSSGDLQGQDGWVAQSQWDADGSGNALNNPTNTSGFANAGGFTRGHNTNVLGSTAIGETMTISADFSLSAFTTPSTDIASFEQGIFQLGMSHQQGNSAFAYGIASGIFYNPANGNIELRANQGLNEVGTLSTTVGAASGLGSTSWTLTTSMLKTGADTWSISTDLFDGVSTTYSIAYTANGQTGDLDADTGGGGIIGGFQSLPSGGGSPGVETPPFDQITISGYSIEVVPEPSTYALLAGLAALSFVAVRRRK